MDKNDYFKQYRKDNLTQLSAAIPKDLAAKLKEKLELDGVSYSRFLKYCIKLYTEDKLLYLEDKKGAEE